MIDKTPINVTLTAADRETAVVEVKVSAANTYLPDDVGEDYVGAVELHAEHLYANHISLNVVSVGATMNAILSAVKAEGVTSTTVSPLPIMSPNSECEM